jgi:hypothetical protein
MKTNNSMQTQKQKVLIEHQPEMNYHFFLISPEDHLAGIECPCSQKDHPVQVVRVFKNGKPFTLYPRVFPNRENAMPICPNGSPTKSDIHHYCYVV